MSRVPIPDTRVRILAGYYLMDIFHSACEFEVHSHKREYEQNKQDNFKRCKLSVKGCQKNISVPPLTRNWTGDELSEAYINLPNCALSVNLKQ